VYHPNKTRRTYSPFRLLDLGGPTKIIFIMSTTSQKHRNFVSEPMGDKPVTDLSGMGEVLGKKLEGQGFDKAYVVLGQYLLLKKNDELFCNWLKETCGANKKQQADCAKCLKEWCDSFMSL